MSVNYMIKYGSDKNYFSVGSGWLFGFILGLILFTICIYIIEEVGFIIGVSIGLGSGTTTGIILELKRFNYLSNEELIEKKHLLFSSFLLIIFGIIMILYVFLF